MSKKKVRLEIFGNSVPVAGRMYSALVPGEFWMDRHLAGKTFDIGLSYRGMNAADIDIVEVYYLPLQLVPPDILMLHYDPRCSTLRGAWDAICEVAPTAQYGDGVSIVLFELRGEVGGEV